MPRAKVNGLELAYELHGDPAGQPLILSMGIASQMVMWPPGFLESLVEEGFYVIAYDYRDIGQSTYLDHLGTPPMAEFILRRATLRSVPAPYRLEDIADDVAGLMDVLGIDAAHMAGVSMGGMVAQTVAIQYPQRVRTLTSLMSTTGGIRESVGAPRALLGLLKPVKPGRDALLERYAEFYEVLAGSRYAVDHEALRERVSKAFDRGLHPAGFSRHFAAILASGDRTEALSKLSLPTLVIHGTEDPLVPLVGGKATAKAIPHARAMWIEGMGHTLPGALYGTFARAMGELMATEKAA